MSKVKNLPASVRQRLLNKAHETGRPYNEILQYYTIERFLYRISKSAYTNKFILKGALMFQAWCSSAFRSTRDIDFLGTTSNEINTVTEIFQEVCVQEVEPDGLFFDAQSVQGERIIENADYEGLRIYLNGFLEKARIPLHLDIGFTDVITPAPIQLIYPTILQMPSPILQGYPKETIVAEKLQALVVLGSINSRMKDYFDLWILATHFEFDGCILKEAILHTFQHRKTSLPENVPTGLHNDFALEKQG